MHAAAVPCLSFKCTLPARLPAPLLAMPGHACRPSLLLLYLCLRQQDTSFCSAPPDVLCLVACSVKPSTRQHASAASGAVPAGGISSPECWQSAGWAYNLLARRPLPRTPQQSSALADCHRQHSPGTVPLSGVAVQLLYTPGKQLAGRGLPPWPGLFRCCETSLCGWGVGDRKGGRVKGGKSSTGEWPGTWQVSSYVCMHGKNGLGAGRAPGVPRQLEGRSLWMVGCGARHNSHGSWDENKGQAWGAGKEPAGVGCT